MNDICLDIRELLDKNIDIKYREFVTPLVPNELNILGVRIPVLRQIAKTIAQRNDVEIFLQMTPTVIEEALLQGMIIGRFKLPDILKWTRIFIPRITNWSICDVFCGNLKITRKHPKIIWDFIQPYVRLNEEFSSRFALIMMLKYFINEEYLSQIFTEIMNVRCKKYYTQMAVAWLLSMCYAKFPNETFEFLKTHKIDVDILAKTTRKIFDSYQISAIDKEKIRRWGKMEKTCRKNSISATTDKIRNSAKIVLLNDKNELLLIGTDDRNIKDINGNYKGRFWQLIGGKIEEEETLKNALKRELFEETALTAEDVEFGPIIWQGELDLIMHGELTRIKQKFILARLKGDGVVNLTHLTQEEKETVTELKWFSLKEIQESKEIIYPGLLPTYLKEILNGHIPNEPIEIDLARGR